MAGVTPANGGDSLAVRTPLFAANLDRVRAWVRVFLALTGLLRGAAFALVRKPALGGRIAPGLAILWGRGGCPGRGAAASDAWEGPAAWQKSARYDPRRISPSVGLDASAR